MTEIRQQPASGAPAPRPVQPAPKPEAPRPAPPPPPPKDQADLKWENRVRAAAQHEGADPAIRAATQVALRTMLGSHVPKDDGGMTHSRHAPFDAQGHDRDRDFGHRPVDLGPVKPGGKEPGPSLYALNTATPGKPEVVWADNGRRITGSQWAAMDPGQRERVASHVEPGQRVAFTQAMDAQAQAFPDMKTNPSVRPDVVDRLQDAGKFLQGQWDKLRTTAPGAPPEPQADAPDALSETLALGDKVDDTLGFGTDVIKQLNAGLAAQAEAARQAGHAALAGDAPDPDLHAPDAPAPGTFESRLGVVAGGLSTIMGVANVYNDLRQLAQDGDKARGLDLVAHGADTLTGLGDLAEGLAGSGIDLPKPLEAFTQRMTSEAVGKTLEVVGGVGLVADGAADMKGNAEAFAKDPNFGNTLGFEIGAMKSAAGSAILSRTPQGVMYGEALALTAGGLEVVKDVYDANPAVKDAIDTAGAFHQQWMGAVYCATQGIPQHVAAAPVKLPPAPAGGWGNFMATHSQAEVAQYYADHGLQAPGT